MQQVGGYGTRFGVKHNSWIQFRQKHAGQGYNLDQLREMYHKKQSKQKHCDHRILKTDRWQCDHMVKGKRPKNTTKKNKFIQAVKKEALASGRLFPEVMQDKEFLARYHNNKLRKTSKPFDIRSMAAPNLDVTSQNELFDRDDAIDIRSMAAPNLDVTSQNELFDRDDAYYSVDSLPEPMAPRAPGAPGAPQHRPLPDVPRSSKGQRPQLTLEEQVYNQKIEEALKQVSRLSDDDIRITEETHRHQLDEFDRLMTESKDLTFGEREQILKMKAEFVFEPYVQAVKYRFDELNLKPIKKTISPNPTRTIPRFTKPTKQAAFDFTRLAAPNVDTESDNLLYDHNVEVNLSDFFGDKTVKTIKKIKQKTNIRPEALLFLKSNIINPISEMDSRSELITLLSTSTDFDERELNSASDEDIIDIRDNFVDHLGAEILLDSAKRVRYQKKSKVITSGLIKESLYNNPIARHLQMAEIINF